MGLKRKVALGLVAAMAMSATAFANPEITEISEVIHYEGSNSYHSHSVGFSDGSSQGWTEGMSVNPVENLPPCPDKIEDQKEACKPTDSTQIYHEEHHYFSNGEERHEESVIGNDYSQTHSWGISNGESYDSHSPEIIPTSEAKSSLCGGKHAEGICGRDLEDSAIDAKSLPLCGRHAEGFCRSTAETQVLSVGDEQKEACWSTETPNIYEEMMNSSASALLDFTMSEHEMIERVGMLESLQRASAHLLSEWPGGIRKDIVMFLSAAHGDYKAMALIRDRYPLFYYTYSDRTERGFVNEALAQYGGINGVWNAYRDGLTFPADTDDLFEATARHH